MTQRNLLITSLIAIMLVMGFVVWRKSQMTFLSQPTPSVQETPLQISAESIDTSDWKTYRNEEYGFEFRYPKEYVIFNDYPDKNTLFLSLPENDIHRVDGVFFKMGSQASTADEVLQKIQDASAAGSMDRVLNDVNLAMGKSHIPVRKITHTAEIGYEPVHYFFHFDGQPIEVEIKAEIPYTQEILDTFMFLGGR